MGIDQLNRKELLEKLITFDFTDFNQIKGSLSNYEWDSDIPLVCLGYSQLERVLQKYIDGDISLAELIEWAEIIEFRDDIDFGKKIKEVVFLLSNQEINEPFTKEKAIQIVKKQYG